ncbi:Nicotinamide riboside kinase [Roseateles sp. YR242]|uniref:AAA family ATPase n=1 Tax=Roseateles sp. YR242 TaxID=1855305 RepID=UPI0008B4829B|nr:ATP-binding protein [Roseateles sp. YR242]SEL60709.1 Nicotinamide riboside kinase [Roseateles sp. YR242]
MALHIALLGAESTGKSQLGLALQDHLARNTRLRPALVTEYLREWCNREGRTPRPDEQMAIAIEQQARGQAAARDHDVVLHDTTPLMTAVYSDQLFQDSSLYPFAIQAQSGMDATLLMALDLPWVADSMRDGPHAQAPTDRLVRRALRAAKLDFSVVGGRGDDRLAQALNALGPLLRAHVAPGDGLFSRLMQRDDSLGGEWHCEHCDDAACEHASRRQRR